MTKEKFTIGAALFDQGIGPMELLHLILQGRMPNPIGRTPECDPCYFCEPARRGSYPSALGGKKPCEHAPLFLCDTATEDELHARLSKALFPDDAIAKLNTILASPPAEERRPEQSVQEVLPDSPEDLVQQLKDKRLDEAEIKVRLYRVGKKKWNLSWWKVHCIVEGLPYPTRDKKGADEKIKYNQDCLRQVRAWKKRK